MNKITKEEIINGDYLTVGDLKEFLYKHNFKPDAKVVVQRVEDVYYEKNNWKVYLKEGIHTIQCKKWNEDVKNGKYLDKEKYPKMKPEILKMISDEDIEKSMEQYSPAYHCVYYDDDKDILFIDLHY